MSALTSFSRRFAENAEPTNLTNKPKKGVEMPTEGLEAFIRRVAPFYEIYDYTRAMIKLLEKAYLGLVQWLFINIPPRFGKTSLLELFAAWCLLNDPTIHIGYCSYNKEIASDPCKNAREHYIAGGGEMNPAQAAKINWETKKRGKMWASGFGGTVRGRGYHIGIVDDAHKDSVELFSEAKVRNWQSFWDKTWLNRGMVHGQRPVVRIVIGQRLGDNDIFAYVLDKNDVGKWTGIVFDFQKDTEEPFDIPEEVTLVEDNRKHGEILQSKSLSQKDIDAIKADDDEFQSQFQQRPRPVAGTIIDVSGFITVTQEQVPLMHLMVGGVDLAITKKTSSDWSVALPLGYGINGKYYIFNPWRDRKESPFLRTEIPAYLRSRGVWAIGVDSTAYQTSFVQELQADPLCAGIVILDLKMNAPDRTDKQVMARSWAWLVKQNLVYLVEDGTGWTNIYKDELKKFPRAKWDDQVDATGLAFHTCRMLIGNANTPTASAA